MVNLPKKVPSYIVLGALVEKLFFSFSAGGHLGFVSLEKNARIFQRDMEAKSFIKVP